MPLNPKTSEQGRSAGDTRNVYFVSKPLDAAPWLYRITTSTKFSHWGVVVGDRLYELHVRNEEDLPEEEFIDGERLVIPGHGYPVKGSNVRFDFTKVKKEDLDKFPEVELVGTTRFGDLRLLAIGIEHIKSFGPYNIINTSCHQLALEFLGLICKEIYGSWESLGQTVQNITGLELVKDIMERKDNPHYWEDSSTEPTKSESCELM